MSQRKPALMKIVIPDDYQDMVDRLECYALIRQHDIVRYREPARDLIELAARLEPVIKADALEQL